MDLRRQLVLIWIAIISETHRSIAISVNPALCPTNKIAPHRRQGSFNRPRTFGHFAQLFSHDDLNSPSSLQEEPEEDDPDDCGDIEDYDEHDLSSLVPHSQRKRGSRLFFGNDYEPENGPDEEDDDYMQHHPNRFRPNRPDHRPEMQYPIRPGQNRPQRPGSPTRPIQTDNNQNNYPTRPNSPHRPEYLPTRPGNGPDHNRPQNSYPVRPTSPPRPDYGYPTRPSNGFRPQKPSYSSGGYFSGNQYSPPYHQYPSDNVKPVYEANPEPSVTYRPGLVGGPLSHVVGVSPSRPSQIQVDEERTTRRPYYPVRLQSRPDKERRPSPRGIKNDSILGSFIDLLLK